MISGSSFYAASIIKLCPLPSPLPPDHNGSCSARCKMASARWSEVAVY